ncbi:hypothetical protein [Chryseobacterium sp. 2VB]|uniref:hypothetical protein n=1 Tax=Chryseobacterium sp. 2VB TaxID=2502204 RepID=UPI0010F5E64F|nr:hypothetical protein [Chryseobacterium sp. 2VB]
MRRGFNQAEFKTTILNKGQKVEEVVEFSLSGDIDKLAKHFGNPPDLPENTIDILSDYDNFEAFVKGASDFEGKPRNYDSEIKYIFNFPRCRTIVSCGFCYQLSQKFLSL